MTEEQKVEAATEEVTAFIKPFLAYFEKGSGLAALRMTTRALANLAYGPDSNPLDPREAGRGLVNAAFDGDRLACDELLGWAKKFLRNGEPLPPELADYIERGPLAEGWVAPRKAHISVMPRDTILLHAIWLAIDRLGCDATRNRDRKSSECACSIVAEALSRNCVWDVTERTLEEVWSRRPKHHRKRSRSVSA